MKDGYRFVDCDMHVMEPHDLFERYMDPKFKHRVTVAPKRTANYVRPNWVVDGLPINKTSLDLQYHRSYEKITRARSEHILVHAIERNYDEEAQIWGMEQEGIDIAVLFPTLGLSILARDGMDPLLSNAISRAYNDWLGEFCSYSPDQLKMAAMLPVHDVNLACEEMIRAHEQYGAVGAFIRPNYVDGHYWHSTYWDPLYGLLQELGVPLCFHEGVGSHYSTIEPRYGENRFMRHVASHSTEMQLAAVAFILGGLFESYPKLRVAFLEAQSWWVPGLLGRMEWDLRQHKEADAAFLTKSPFEYWNNNCFSAIESGEREVGSIVELLGSADNICVSTDYPHFDSSFPEVSTRLLSNPSITREIGSRILSGGARLYGFTEVDYAKADAAAAARKQARQEVEDAMPVGD